MTLIAPVKDVFDRGASRTSKATGSATAFALAVLVIAVWGLTGPIFRYSDTWQLVINTGTTIVTFLMVFLLQHAQAKDTLALQLKLNELLAATQGASNRLIDLEDLNERELAHVHERFRRLATSADRLGRGDRMSVDETDD